jgi:hypothetical protein
MALVGLVVAPLSFEYHLIVSGGFQDTTKIYVIPSVAQGILLRLIVERIQRVARHAQVIMGEFYKQQRCVTIKAACLAVK